MIMSKIDKKTVDWCCKVIRKDMRRYAKKDDPDLGYLPAAIRVNKRITNCFLSIPKKDQHNKNKRAVFLCDAMICTDTMLKRFQNDWRDIPYVNSSFADKFLSYNYYDNVNDDD